TRKLRVRRSYSSGSMGKKICSTDGTSTPTRSMNQVVSLLCIVSVSISLQGLGLSGELAASSLCRVRGLVALSLASNGFEGQVPLGLAALGGILQVLDLGENLLSGVLHPTLFSNLTSLLNWRKSRVAIISVCVACFIVFMMIRSVIGLFRRTMSIDLCKNGYMPGYEVWVHHGEDPPPRIVSEVQSHEEEDYDRMEEMLDDVRHELLTVDSENPGQPTEYEDPATPEVQKFFELLKAAEEPLHEHTKVTVLVFVTRLMAIKSKFAFSNNCYKELLNLISDVLPENHKMPKDMYQSKKLLSGLEYHQSVLREQLEYQRQQSEYQRQQAEYQKKRDEYYANLQAQNQALLSQLAQQAGVPMPTYGMPPPDFALPIPMLAPPPPPPSQFPM
ncbi:hypothetical protein ACJX0J_042180, partial [Zea mays]